MTLTGIYVHVVPLSVEVNMLCESFIAYSDVKLLLVDATLLHVHVPGKCINEKGTRAVLCNVHYTN